MLGQVAREPDDLFHKRHGFAQARITRVEAHLADLFLGRGIARPPSPKLRGQRTDRIIGEAHGSSHFANGALTAIMDHRGTQAGAVPSIALIDILDHLFAAFMFEIDIDIGGLIPCFRDETFKDHRTDFR